jgi:hypothetical protein
MQNVIWILVFSERNNEQEYGPMNITMSLLHRIHKSRRMNSMGNFYAQFFQQHKTIINEQSQKTPFF